MITPQPKPFKLNKKTIRLISGLIAVGVALVFGYFQKPALEPQKAGELVYQEGKSYKVTKVYDGDTFELEGGARVRLIGIDTPEDYPNEKAARDSMRTGIDVGTIVKTGKEAKEFVKNLVEGMQVRLEFDVEKKDKYGRLLAYAFIDMGDVKIKAPADWYYVSEERNIALFVNATIVRAGYASTMTIPPNIKYAELFQKLYQGAREGRRGLWR